MGLSFFNFFTHARSEDEGPDLSGLLQYAEDRALKAYHHPELFHLDAHAKATLVLFDRHRGLYLFDVVDWEFDAVKDAKASAATPGNRNRRAVSVDGAHRIMERRLEDLPSEQRCDVCNFLYLPGISRSEYEQLDPSLKALLPETRLLLSDESHEAIDAKLRSALPSRDTPLHSGTVLASLFAQYALLPDNLHNETALLTPDQQRYIDTLLPKHSLLVGPAGSGKSSLLLLKALAMKLDDPRLRIVIVATSVVAAELMARRLLEMIERAVVPVDPATIRIMTPAQIARAHYLKLYNAPPVVDGNITEKMMHRRFDIADVMFCDDADAMEPRYLAYLRHLQSGKPLHLVAAKSDGFDVAASFSLRQGFRVPDTIRRYAAGTLPTEPTGTLVRLRGNAYLHTLKLIPVILEDREPDAVLIVTPTPQIAANLIEDLEGYTGLELKLLEMHKTLLNQTMGGLLVVSAGALQGLQRQQVIVIDDGSLEPSEVAAALSRASERAYLIEHSE